MKTIKNIFIFGTVAVMSLLLGSCSKESINSGDDKLPAGAMCIELSTSGGESAKSRAGLQTDAESKVTSARIFFYKDGALVKLLSTGDNGVSVDGSKIVILNGGISSDNDYNIVVVANWTTGFKATDYPENSARSLLSETLTTITEQIPAPDDTHPLLMSGEIASHNFKDNPVVPIDLVRQAVKLSVKVKISDAFKKAYPDAVFGSTAGNVLISMNVPSSSFVTASAANTTYPTSVLAYSDLGMSFSADEWTTTAYAYENPVQGTDDAAKARATYFILKMPYKLDATSNAVTDNYYKFYINDPNDTTNPHKTVRNTIYNVTVTVNGFGQESVIATTSVQPWNVENIDTSTDGGYVSIESIRAGISDLFDDPDYIYPTEGKQIIIQLAANVGGTRIKIIDDKGRVVAQAAPTTEKTTYIELMAPNNVGIENGVPVAPRRLTLQITNFKAKIHFNSDVAVNLLQTTHEQGALVWAEKNIGATTPQDGGYVYQYDRNTPFLLTPPLLNKTVSGPVSKEDAAGMYNDSFITIPTVLNNEKPVYSSMNWADAGGIANLWQTPATNPCSTYGDPSVNWMMPTTKDYNVVQGLSEKKNPYTGAPFGWQFDVTDAKLFFPFCGIRVSDDSVIIGAELNGGTSYWTRDINTDLGGAKTFDVGVGRRIVTNAYSTACPIRCVRYIK